MIPYILRWISPYLRKNKAPAIIMFLLIIALAVIQLYQANYIQQGVDAALNREWGWMLASLGMFAGMAGLRLMRNVGYGIAANRFKANVTRDMKEDLTRAMLEADLQGIEKLSDGERVTRHNQDIDSAVSFIANGFGDFLLNPIMTIGGFCYLFYFHWKLSIAVFAAMPVLAILLNQMSARAGRIHQRRLEYTGSYLEKARDAINGAETVRAFQMQEAFSRKAGKEISHLYDTDIQYSKNGGLALGIILGVTDIPMVISLIYGGFLVLRGEIPVSLLFAYAQLIPIVATPAICVFSSLNSMKEAYRSMKRLDDILLAKPERAGGCARIPDGDLQFHKVGFQYTDGRPVLKDITLCIKPGVLTGIAGDSGAGKSTLFHLICGFYQADRGKINIFGEELSKWDLTSLRRNIAYVSQESQILPGSVSENIRYGKPEASLMEIEDAARRAGLLDWIQTLPQGMDTPLTEKGETLSGGQKQRISIARAFLQDAKLILLDEPASALDPKTEALIMENIERMAKDHILLLSSHRLSTLEWCQEVWLLQDGALTEHGTAHSLMEKQGAFYQLFQGKEESK